ncbi:hypothetical protein ACEPAG_5187 [Sanghuangporus baumii]
MAKKSGKVKEKLANSTSNVSRTPPGDVQFPSVSPKESLVVNDFVPDKILLIPDVFDESECKRFIELIEELPLELTPTPKKGEAVRVNHRIVVQSPSFAATLFSLLSPHLPDFPLPESRISRKANSKPDSNVLKARPAHSFNSNIRMYKYTEGQHFGCHYDDSMTDPVSGAHSEWTLLIYLSGKEDGVIGGETIFYPGEGKKKDKEVPIKPELQRGMALLHRHGYECLRHEGSAVQKGVKYVLRSDVMFMD